MHDSNYLFTEHVGSWSIIEHQQKEMTKLVEQLSESACTKEGVIDEIAQKFSINVPIIDDEAASASQAEVEVDVSRDQNRYFSIPGQSHTLRGLRITISVPFSGDAIFFRFQPDTYGPMPPRGEVHGSSLVFITEGVGLDGDKIKGEYQTWLSSVKQNLEWHRSKYVSFDQSLRTSAVAAISSRINILRKNNGVLGKLGLPVQTSR